MITRRTLFGFALVPWATRADAEQDRLEYEHWQRWEQLCSDPAACWWRDHRHATGQPVGSLRITYDSSKVRAMRLWDRAVISARDSE